MEVITMFHNRVVVGFDGSEPSLGAARWAAREAQTRGLGLTVIHATVPPMSSSGAWGPSAPISLDALDEIRTSAQTSLDAFAATLPSADIQTLVQVGSPTGILLAASESAALIVVGSRGHGGFKELLLGSVSQQLVTHADCPVAVIRDDRVIDATAVVVGVDGSAASHAAVDFAFDYASRHHLRVLAVHAWDVPSFDLIVMPNTPVPIQIGDIANTEVRLAAELLAGYEARYPDVTLETRVIRTTPANAILSAEPEAAAIVMGTRGHGAVVGSIIGSVSHSVLHRATVPVVVVTEEAHEDDAA
ncbi:MAG: universal stress protein [Candidatus Nanopelagicales bacterium]|nr:universal stress protein [Candidatus Nanopelagicales bacterium]